MTFIDDQLTDDLRVRKFTLDRAGRPVTGVVWSHPDEVDPDRLSVCTYWRCGELFERRTANQRYCRKACRSRQNKWLRAVERRRRRSAGQ